MDKPAASRFRRAFVKATQQLRDRTGLSQQQLAIALGVDLPRYKQWERRSPLPPEFMERFCITVRTEPSEVFALASRLLRQAATAADSAEAGAKVTPLRRKPNPKATTAAPAATRKRKSPGG